MDAKNRAGKETNHLKIRYRIFDLTGLGCYVDSRQ
jgi:hypothetical protein